MFQMIINTAVPILVTAAVSILVAIITAVGTAAFKLIVEKIKAVKVKVGADKFDAWLKAAKATYLLVDEKFRITPALTKTFESAQAMFTVEFKKIYPAITDEQIETVRQAIAGEINKGKADIVAEIEPTTPTSTEPTISTATAEAIQAAINLLLAAMPSTVATSTDALPDTVTPVVTEAPTEPAVA